MDFSQQLGIATPARIVPGIGLKKMKKSMVVEMA